MIARASDIQAPSGYVAYVLRLWGNQASGSFSSVFVNENGALVFAQALPTDDGTLVYAHSERVEKSVIFLPKEFVPSRGLLARQALRPANVAPPGKRENFLILKPLGLNPNDSTLGLFEATLDSVVFLHGSVIPTT